MKNRKNQFTYENNEHRMNMRNHSQRADIHVQNFQNGFCRLISNFKLVGHLERNLTREEKFMMRRILNSPLFT